MIFMISDKQMIIVRPKKLRIIPINIKNVKSRSNVLLLIDAAHTL